MLYNCSFIVGCTFDVEFFFKELISTKLSLFGWALGVLTTFMSLIFFKIGCVSGKFVVFFTGVLAGYSKGVAFVIPLLAVLAELAFATLFSTAFAALLPTLRAFPAAFAAPASKAHSAALPKRLPAVAAGFSFAFSHSSFIVSTI